MSSDSQPCDSQVSSSHVSHVLQYDSPPTRTPGATPETNGSSPRLRFTSLSLDELSEDLDRRTKETQRLQEEVENETKMTLERFGCAFSIHSSPEQISFDHFNYYVSPGDSTIPSPQQQPETQALVCDVEGLNQGDISTPGKEALTNEIDDCILQLSDLQLNKTQTCDQPEQETFSFNKAIVNLQAEWHKVQNEKAALSNLRVKDSMTHVDQMEKMLFVLEELQDIKRTKDQKLQEKEERALAFYSKLETLEHNVKEMYSGLSNQAQGGDSATSSPNVGTASRQMSPAASSTEGLNNESEKLQERLSPQSIQHLGSEESSGVNGQNERMENLIGSLGQEMALLTGKLSSSKSDSFSLSLKLEILKKLAERETLLHHCEVSELQSQLLDSLRERNRSLQRAEELQSRLDRLFEGLLEQRARDEKTSQELREEKMKEVQFWQHEAQNHLARSEEAQSRCQTLLAERETLTLKLEEREKMTESSLQMHNSTVDDLRQENSRLRNQLNQHKLEIQQLGAELERHRSDLAAAELDRLQLQASVAAHSLRVQEETLETFPEELQQLHSCKSEEHKGAALKPPSQLRNTHDELHQFRCTLRTLKGVDGHGLQVATDMQKEITARREQVDSLQCKIQHLEEIKDKLYQEKHYQSLENQHHLQDLTFIREEKRQLGNELEALRSKDKQLRERIGQLEAILHKMSESFADCQYFIQLKEQDFFRLKLQHALDLKELQGQNVHTALNAPPSDPDSPSPSALAAPPSSRHVSNTQIPQCRAWELRSLVEELRGVISENHGPHTDTRRRSAPERVHRITLSADKAKEVKADSRLRRRTCGSEPHFLKAAEIDGKMFSKKSFCESCVVSRPAPAGRFPSSPQLLGLGRRSPVYSLLTSDPNS